MGECPRLQMSPNPPSVQVSLSLHTLFYFFTSPRSRRAALGSCGVQETSDLFFQLYWLQSKSLPPSSQGENVPCAMNAAFLYLTGPTAVWPLTERPATVHRPLGTLILLLLLFAKVKFRGSWAPLYFILLSVKHGGREGFNIMDISQKCFTAEIKRI